jgi:hypothetical protein
MKKINILLAVAFSFGLAGCYDLDKMPEGVLSTANPFQSVVEKIDNTGLWKYRRWSSTDTILDEYDVFVETERSLNDHRNKIEQ